MLEGSEHGEVRWTETSPRPAGPSPTRTMKFRRKWKWGTRCMPTGPIVGSEGAKELIIHRFPRHHGTTFLRTTALAIPL